MEGCLINVDANANPAMATLKKVCNDKNIDYLNCLKHIVKDNSDTDALQFTDNFKQWWNEHYKTPLDMNTTTPKLLSSGATKFYNATVKTVASTNSDNIVEDKHVIFGYSSVSARELAKRIVANSVLQKYNSFTNIKHEKRENMYGDSVSAAIRFLKITLANTIAKHKGVDINTILPNLNDNVASYLDTLLDETIPVKLQNQIALYKELTTYEEDGRNYRNEFIDEVFRDSRLKDIRNEKVESDDDIITNAVSEETQSQDAETDNDTTTRESNYDVSIRVYESHLGLSYDFKTHIGTNLHSVLGTIYKLKSYDSIDGKPAYNIDNELGIPDVYDVNDIATLLYAYGSFYDNADAMVEHIDLLAKTMPGFAGLKTLVETLNANSDLKYDMYKTFAKMCIAKTTTNISDGVGFIDTSNKTFSKLDVLRFSYINAFKTTALENDYDFCNSVYNAINRKFNNIAIDEELNNKEVNYFAEELSKLLRFYIPINKESIKLYICDVFGKNKKSRYENVQKLLQTANSIITNTKEVQRKYKEIEKARIKAYYNAQFDSFVQANTPGTVDNTNSEELDNLYRTPYVTNEDMAPLLELAKELLNYTHVNIDLNSINPHGNQASSVINNSLISNLMHTFESVLNERDANGKMDDNSPLMQFAKHKFQSQQYDFSNLLIEDKETGNKGLFRLIDGQYVPTEYAEQLIRFSLFDGATNRDTGNSVLNSEMSVGDIIGTAWINFFDAHEIEDGKGKGIRTAEYFLRTPSDAKNAFLMRAPRYNISNLRIVANSQEIQDAIVEEVNNLIKPLETADDIDNKKRSIEKNSKGKYLTSKTLLKHIRANGKSNLKIQYLNDEKLEGQQVRLSFTYLTNESEDKIKYVLSGTYSKGMLYNATFEGFVNPDNVELISDLRSALQKEVNKTGKIGNIRKKYKINTNHTIYKQFRRIFLQELQDATTALHVMFYDKEIENGVYIAGATDGKGKIKFRKGTNSSHGHLISGYHFNGENIISYKDKIANLTGRVFTSDRFTIYTPGMKEPRNYGDEIIKEAIDFLYRGYGSKVLRYTIDDNDKVTPIITSDLEAIIETKLSEFINDYVANSMDRLEQYAGFIKSEINNEFRKATFNIDNVAEFMLNYRLMFTYANDLLEGDSKFYKDSQTELKRAKEYQGSGVLYGMADFTQGIDNLIPGKNDVERNHIQSILDTQSYGVQLRRTFEAVTIKNTILTDTETITRLKNQLIYNVHLSDDKASALMEGYADVIVNDAQSYITLDEWVRRIVGRGQFFKYKHLIDKLYDENAEITAEDLNEFAQVQKNFYYDQHYNVDCKTIAPRHIKNAELVLVPKFIKGTELEYVYKLMNKYGIDQLNTEETSKAAKSFVLEVFDENTGELKEDVKNEIDTNGKKVSAFGKAMKLNAKESFDYNHLYTQQETPQHMNATNKAGIQIMKKIIDNIDANSSLFNTKDRFLKLYTANIKESFTNLMDEFNIEVDDNGNIVLDENGEVKGLDYKVFYDRLAKELERLGTNSNMTDYITLTDLVDGETRMPNYFTFVAQKLENIAQALFNNNITRQKLSGFHAAQVSNIGFKKIFDKNDKGIIQHNGDLQYHPQLYVDTHDVEITENEWKQLSEEEKKKYKKSRVAPWVEIMLPASAFGFNRNAEAYKNLSKEEQDRVFLSQLRVNNLDTLIGYRMPTEGKESICVMKVVGFIDDAQGSTIVVPNMWVPQTGSDFDIDSVYSIQKNVIFTSDGQIQSIKYYDGETPGDDERLYVNYIRRSISKEKWDELRENKRLHESFIDKIFDDVKKDDSIPKNKKKEEALKRIRKESRKIFEEDLTDVIKENNLKSFNEFNKLSIEERNSRKARENWLIDCMIDILSSDESLEETLSRSNFDDITEIKKEIYKSLPEFEKARKARSAYDFIDQALYHEDAVSAIKLKGFSVTRDNLCSIANTAKIKLSDTAQVSVIYTFDKKEINNKYEELSASFDIVEKISDTQIKVTHNSLGHTKNNRNVVGKLLTPYSSQTTAFCLDVMKAGNIPNVNDYTFGIFKIFPDIGSDYRTATSFIMQNGISKIVDNYNATNSVYTDEISINHIYNAIYEFAQQLHVPVTRQTKLETVLENINDKYGEVLSNLFGIDIKLSLDEKNINIPFNSELQIERLKDNLTSLVKDISKSELNALYDIATCLQFYKLQLLANDLRSYGFVLNLDKSGAKQTIFETNRIFDSIKDLSDVPNPRLLIDGNVAISEIYPDADKGLEEFIKSEPKTSKYPTAYAFLRYATAPSILINRKLFITQNKIFVNYINSFSDLLSNGKRLNEKQYKKIQNYIINALYKQTAFINTSLQWSKEEGYNYRQEILRNPNLAEYSRVFGYGHNPDFSVIIASEDIKDTKDGVILEQKAAPVVKKVKIKNIKNPTKEELADYVKLSPAQKVAFIQKNFDEQGIFEFINVSLHNDYRTGKYVGRQTIMYKDDAIDIETAYNLFYQAFTNTNPIISLAAMDLVKYAFIVEGYDFKKSSISKIIKNEVLIADDFRLGTGIVNDMNYAISKLDAFYFDNYQLKENFIRSHSEYVPTRRVIRDKKTGYEIATRKNGFVVLPKNDVTDALVVKYGIGYRNTETNAIELNSYINLTYGNKTTLYRIDYQDGMGYVLIPLNKLESTENDTWSANVSNNTAYPRPEYYQKIIDEYQKLYEKQIITVFSSERLSELINATSDKEYREINNNNLKRKVIKSFKVSKETSLGRQLIDTVNRWYDNAIADKKPTIYITNTQLSQYIPNIGNYRVVSIPIGDGSRQVRVRIERLNVKHLVKNYVNKSNEVTDEAIKDLVSFLKDLKKNWGGINSNISSVYAISDATMEEHEDDEGLVFSTKDDVIIQGIKVIRNNAYALNDNPARQLANRWKSNYVTRSQESIQANSDALIAEIGKYVLDRAKEINDSIKSFIPDPDNKEHYLSITDPKVFELVKKDRTTRMVYLRTLQEPAKLITQFKSIADFDLTSDDTRTNEILKKVQKALYDIENSNLINTAKENYIKNYIDKTSDSPIIRQGLISVLDGFYRTSWANAMFNDIQETPNPLIQSIMKDTMSVLRAEEMNARKKIAEFQKQIKELEKQAKTNGQSFDFSKIIDKNGKFIQTYNDKFLQDRNKLQHAVSNAKINADEIAMKKGRNSHEFIKAYKDYLWRKLEYNEWKVKHLHQKVTDDYYEKANEAVRDILTYSPYIYTLYESLREERLNLRKQLIDDKDDPELDKKLEDLDIQIRNLSSLHYIHPITGEFIEKEDPFGDLTEDEKIDDATTNLTAAIRLNNFRKNFQNLNNEYFKYDPRYNFMEEVNKYQTIIDNAEQKNANGIPTASVQDLANNEEYQNAKRWINRNAIKKPLINDETSWYNDLSDAYDIISSRPDHDDFVTSRKLYKYRDEFGSVDMISLFTTNKDIAKKIVEALKANQSGRYNISNNALNPERVINSVGARPKVVFNSSFYRRLTGLSAKRSLATESESREITKKWNEIVNAINEILAPYYVNSTKQISFAQLINDNSIDVIKTLTKLADLFDELDDIQREKSTANKSKKTESAKAGIRDFIENYVNFNPKNEAFEADEKLVTDKNAPANLRKLLSRIIYGIDPITEKRVPNRFLYSTPSLKLEDENAIEKYLNNDLENISEHDKSVIKEFVDIDKTKAIRTIEKYTYKQPTSYYYTVEADVRAGNAERYGYKNYNEWYEANHIYNVNTGTYEPLNVWMKTSTKDTLNYVWEAKFPQLVSTVNDGYGRPKKRGAITEEELEESKTYHPEYDHVNKNYKQGSHALNYKKGSNPQYDNKIDANEYELAAKVIMQDTCSKLMTTSVAKRRFEEGWIPAMAKTKVDVTDAKFWGKEFLKIFGWNETSTGYEDWKPNEEINYENDELLEMPMMQMLTNKYIADKQKEFEKLRKPIKSNFINPLEYEQKLREYNDAKAKLDKEKEEIHAQLRDTDPIRSISNFILQASKFNAIQSAKYQLYFAQQMINNYGTYERQYAWKGDLKKKSKYDRDYEKTLDENLQKQFANVIRRMVYDQWKEPNAGLTKWMSVLQSFTSAKYMTFNIKGGVANVTYGDSQIWGETMAREYLGTGTIASANMILAKATSRYLTHMTDYIGNAYSEKSSSLEGALIKFFDVVSYDEHNGIGHITVNVSELFEKLRDASYFQQSAGEHYMQNKMLFALLDSHILVDNERATEFGQPAKKYVNYEEFIRDEQFKLLKEYLNDTQKEELDKMIERIKKDANRMKDFAWYRNDIVQVFRRNNLDNEQRKEFTKKWDARKKELSKEFKSKPTLMSQLELGKDGKLAIKADSELAKLDVAKKDGSLTDAMQLLANFKGRVISINKKIHGVYDKSGRAQIEKTWFGGLLMQYHKHLPMGLFRRFRRTGYFNEERGSIEKGSYVSLWHFITIPWDEMKQEMRLSEDSVNALKSVQMYFTHLIDFISKISLNYKELPEYDKANIRRNWGDLVGGVGAFLLVAALRSLAENGDVDDDDLWGNFLLYQGDRLATESLQYTPVFIGPEGKKLWQSPVAGFNGINDMIMTMQMIASSIFDPEFDPYYQSGKFAGKSKLTVRLENNVPLWRGIKSSFVDISENNKYYKVGKNIIGIAGYNN